MLTADEVIRHLRLEPLPVEGGFFRRTWTSRASLANGRPAGTAIYFLLAPDAFSALHRLDAEELWHFHAGDPVEHLQLGPAGGTTTLLGTQWERGYIPQLFVPAGVWQGARLAASAPHVKSCGWALVGCTMTPGWDERGFTLANRHTLLAGFPSYAERICALTRDAALPATPSEK